MYKTVVLNVVGLTPNLLDERAPYLRAFAESGHLATVTSVLPAVTCSVQTTYLTGAHPSEHGIVGNGWYFRDECEIKFWRQSNKLVQGPKLWDAARSVDPTFTCANLFWWYNMYSTVDYAVTPRPMYPADGRKIPDIYTQPADLRRALQVALGPFPLFEFWGPNTSIRSTRWIAEAAKRVQALYDPTLTLIYLPHLDYCLQKLGPEDPQTARDLGDLDAVCGELIELYRALGARVIVLSEYGIVPSSRAVHINRLLREHGLLTVREELGRELLDPGASAAFAVADHQIAHIYVNDSSQLTKVRSLIESMPGVADVLDSIGKRAYHLDHPRSGDLVAVAERNAWFTYYYWLDDRRAPDYAKTVDIHRKPGYDPVELILDPELRIPQLKLAQILLKKRLGFRYLMDVIPLDASLVRGTHGCIATSREDSPVFVTHQPELLDSTMIEATSVHDIILRHIFN